MHQSRSFSHFSPSLFKKHKSICVYVVGPCGKPILVCASKTRDYQIVIVLLEKNVRFTHLMATPQHNSIRAAPSVKWLGCDKPQQHHKNKEETQFASLLHFLVRLSFFLSDRNPTWYSLMVVILINLLNT